MHGTPAGSQLPGEHAAVMTAAERKQDVPIAQRPKHGVGLGVLVKLWYETYSLVTGGGALLFLSLLEMLS